MTHCSQRPVYPIALSLVYEKTWYGVLACSQINHSLTSNGQNLKGQEFSWASGIFYIGYLAASYPISLGFVRFPLGRYLSALMYAIPPFRVCLY